MELQRDRVKVEGPEAGCRGKWGSPEGFEGSALLGNGKKNRLRGAKVGELTLPRVQVVAAGEGGGSGGSPHHPQ